MSKDLEALRTACNAKGISCRGKKGGYLHRRTLISKMQGGAGARQPLAPLVFAPYKVIYGSSLNGSHGDIKNHVTMAIMQTMPEIIDDVDIITQYGKPLPNGVNPTILNVRLYNHPDADTGHVYDAIHGALAPYRVLQHGGVRPRGPNPFAEFANRHRMLLTGFLVKGDPDEIINIADSTIRREIKAFPEIKRKDWKITMEGAHAIDDIYPYVLNVWIENHPELTYDILRPIVDNVRNALAHLIIPSE